MNAQQRLSSIAEISEDVTALLEIVLDGKGTVKDKESGRSLSINEILGLIYEKNDSIAYLARTADLTQLEQPKAANDSNNHG